MLFRGIQELMGHSRDYASSNELLVRLDMSNDRIKVDVEDNGRGFDAEAAFTGDETHLEPRAQGLLTLKEKFELVGGALSVSSSETDGTRVHIELPASDETY
jgi:signal transduction histidine kinase